MKGTLFSADFVKDSNGNLRLLEFNTDTGILDQEVINFDFNGINQVLVENNISEVEIIYKHGIHKKFVDEFSSSVSLNVPSVTSIKLHEEDFNAIYPTSIQDSTDKFIFRLAYDESALFDSEYCKNRLNVFNLFTDNSINDYCVGYYHSSSLGVKNTLTKEINPNNIADATIKDVDEGHNPIDFFKIGSQNENESVEDRWDNFISENTSEDKLIEQFHFHSSSLDENNHLTSTRFFGLVYGPNLQVIPLHSYKVSSIFDLPSDLSDEIDINQYSNKIPDYHYYEFTTNYMKGDSTGILSSHEVLGSDDVWKSIGEYQVGDSVKSYSLYNYDETDSSQTQLSYSFEGGVFPSGSSITSSVVIFKNTVNLRYNSMFELKVDNDSFFSGLGKRFIVFNSTENKSSFKSISLINPETDFLFNLEGNLIEIDELNFYVSTDSNLNYVELDVEESDTYIVNGTTPINTIVTHNAPCFVGGTQILLEDETTKNIEDISIGEFVLSFDFKTNKIVSSKVLNIFSKKVDKVVEYEFANGVKLKATLDHPIYVIDKGWSSYSDKLSNSLYKLDIPVQKIELNDIIKFNNGESELINVTILNEENVVYNLSEIDTFHNFFANGVSSHNRGPTTLPYCFIAGTQVSMADGTEKNIEDIVIGNEVLSYNEETKIIEPKKVTGLNSPIHDDLVEYTLSNGTTITSTFDHPFYVNGLSLASYQPNLTNERYELPSEVGKIQVGDLLNLVNKEIVEIVSIVKLDRVNTQTHIISVEDNRNFYANKILVHNK